MKRITSIIAGMLLLIPAICGAAEKDGQSTAPSYATYRPERVTFAPGTRFRRPRRVIDSPLVSNSSLSMTLVGGLEFSCESVIARRWTIVGRAGSIPTGLWISHNADSFNVDAQIGLGVTVEPRYYTSIFRRMEMGRDTYNNSSDFVAVSNSLMYVGDGLAYTCTPMYGIRRCGGRHWVNEFAFGLRIFAYGDVGASPYTQYRLAFVF